MTNKTETKQLIHWIIDQFMLHISAHSARIGKNTIGRQNLLPIELRRLAMKFTAEGFRSISAHRTQLFSATEVINPRDFKLTDFIEYYGAVSLNPRGIENEFLKEYDSEQAEIYPNQLLIQTVAFRPTEEEGFACICKIGFETEGFVHQFSLLSHKPSPDQSLFEALGGVLIENPYGYRKIEINREEDKAWVQNELGISFQITSRVSEEPEGTELKENEMYGLAFSGS